jgi:E3 ubiquitin-protein ligase RFWD3
MREVSDFLKTYTHLSPFTKDMQEFSKDGACVVCLDTMSSKGENVRKIFKCGHIFHDKCVTNWVKRNMPSPKCPNCMQLMKTK